MINNNVDYIEYKIIINPKLPKDYDSIIKTINDYPSQFYVEISKVNLTEINKNQNYIYLNNGHHVNNIEINIYCFGDDSLNKAKKTVNDLITIRMKKQKKIKFNKISIECRSIYGIRSINNLFFINFFNSKYKKNILILSYLLIFFSYLVYKFIFAREVDWESIIYTFIIALIGLIASLYGNEGI